MPPPPPTAEGGTGTAHTRESNISRLVWVETTTTPVLDTRLFHERLLTNLLPYGQTFALQGCWRFWSALGNPQRQLFFRWVHFAEATEKRPELFVDETGYQDDATPTMPSFFAFF